MTLSSIRRVEMGETIENRSKEWLETMEGVTVSKMIDKSHGTSEDGEECRLLPKLPDDVTLLEIVPQLDWRTCYLLSAVNRSWRQANKKRQVYDVRVRSPSTERHFVLSHVDEARRRVISLYSMRDNSLRRLPKFPSRQEYDNGIPSYCTHIALEGKIYALGGIHGEGFIEEDEDEDGDGDMMFWFNDGGEDADDMMGVYVLDLAGQREWQQCASMPQRRIGFDFGIMDGLIYVFGGVYRGKPVDESVVYDPKANMWSSTRPMMYSNSLHRVVVQDEKNQWKVLERFEHHHMREFFTVQGKLYRIELEVLGIFVDTFDGQGNPSATCLHVLSFLKEGVEIDMRGCIFMQVCPLEDGSGEILILAVKFWGVFLFKSKGFGSGNELLSCLSIDVPFPKFPDLTDRDEVFVNFLMLPFQL